MENIKNKKWKVVTCFAGEDCWCRMVVTEDYRTDKDDDEVFIASAAVNKEEAEYVVELHNTRLENGTKNT